MLSGMLLIYWDFKAPQLLRFKLAENSNVLCPL